MVNPHHVAHWYPTAAYLYVLWLDALALAWEYLRRHPEYRLDWLRRARRPDAAHRWGLRVLEDPALDARDAHPAWQPRQADVVQLYPDADPPVDAEPFTFWRIPGHKQLLHDGKALALIARSPGQCLRFALAPGLQDGMAVAYAHRGGGAGHDSLVAQCFLGSDGCGHHGWLGGRYRAHFAGFASDVRSVVQGASPGS